MKVLMGDFSAKVGKQDMFKLIIGNESLHEVSNDNGAWNFKKICQECNIPTL
jgi:hypothetical protein